MPKYKRQHFSAQSHLQRFADEGGHLQIINVATGEVEDHRHPKSVGMENYFYGREEREIREHGFKLVEDDANTWMNEIQQTEELPIRGSLGHITIAMWTALQHGRTRKGRNAVNKAMSTLGITSADVDGIALLSSIWSGLEFPHMYDLSYMLVRVTGGKNLWIGDNPVVRMNPWLENKGIRNGFGTAWWDRGLCVVVPITKRLAIIWYDGVVYEAPSQDERKIEFKDVDAEWLNARQIRNSTDECYCPQGTNIQPAKLRQWKMEIKPMPIEMLKLSERWCSFEEKCRQAGVDTIEIQAKTVGNVRQRKLFNLAKTFRRKVEAGEVDVGDWRDWFESNKNPAI